MHIESYFLLTCPIISFIIKWTNHENRVLTLTLAPLDPEPAKQCEISETIANTD